MKILSLHSIVKLNNLTATSWILPNRPLPPDKSVANSCVKNRSFLGFFINPANELSLSDHSHLIQVKRLPFSNHTPIYLLNYFNIPSGQTNKRTSKYARREQHGDHCKCGCDWRSSMRVNTVDQVVEGGKSELLNKLSSDFSASYP